MMQASTGHPEVEHAPRIVYEDFMKLVPPLCPSQVFKVRGARAQGEERKRERVPGGGG